MPTINTTDDSFENDVLKSSGPVLVDFWAEWCSPCKMIAPALEEIADTMADKVTVAKINIDDNPMTPSKFGIKAIPTMILFKNGQAVAQLRGAKPKNKLIEWVNQSI